MEMSNPGYRFNILNERAQPSPRIITTTCSETLIELL